MSVLTRLLAALCTRLRVRSRPLPRLHLPRLRARSAREALRLAGERLRESRLAFRDGNFRRCEELAREGLRALERRRPPHSGQSETPARARSALRSVLVSMRGGAAAQLGRFEEAVRFHEEALRLARSSGPGPLLGPALLNLADIYTRRARFAEAEPLLEEAQRIAATEGFRNALGRVLVERGIAQTGAGKLPDAIRSLDRAEAVRPAWPSPPYHRAWARFLLGDNTGALEDYRTCASRRRVYYTVQREIRCLDDVASGRLPLDVYRVFCALRERARQRPEAVRKAAGRMIERAPAFAPAHLLLAEAQLALSEPEHALEAVRASLRLDPDPDTASSALFLEWMLCRQAGEERACELAQERLETAYRGHPAAAMLRKALASENRAIGLRWTFALDGTLVVEEVDPALVHRREPGADRAPTPASPPPARRGRRRARRDPIPPDQTPPPPESPE